VGIASNWKLKNDIYHADRLTIAQSFADLYLEEKDPAMLEKIQWVMDMHVDRSAKADVRFKDNPYAFEWWIWCDALYMAPPTFARIYAATSDIKYLDYINRHWWKTSDYLYDTIEHLYFRDDRFRDAKTEHGKKVFWSRGNRWVMGGLARVLQYLPQDYPTREKFIQQFKEMAAKIATIQGPDGLWRSSLLDTEEFPVGESSESAFFCYAFAWGINNGFLSKDKYLTHVLNAWKALVNIVNNEGRLGYVQQI
jgi:rhamnogalacturonyl hydrolase YesR